MSENKRAEVRFEVGLDSGHLPVSIEWSATDAPEGGGPTKAVMLSVWNAAEKKAMTIDLWTKDMLVDEMKEFGSLGPKSLKGTPVTIHLNVADVDAAMKRAADAGAKTVLPAADMFWGDRYGVLEDPFGHRWSVATHQRDLTPAEIKKAMQGMGGAG